MAFTRLLLKAVALAAFIATVSAGNQNQNQNQDQNQATLEPCPTMPPTPSDSTTCKTLKNKDRFGFDLRSVQGNVKSCDDACNAVHACKTWAWNDYNGGTCWLKSFAGPIVNKAGVTTTECTFNGASSGSVDTCKLQYDIDLGGDDIGNKPAKNANLCCEICEKFDKCTAFSWSNHNGGTCWLKKNVGRKFANAGVISSAVDKLENDGCSFVYDTDFEGNDIGNKPAKNAGVCCSICKANKDCKAYSWSDYNSGTCWMKSAKGKAINKKGVISAKLA